MVRIEQIADAALEGKGIATRSLVQDFFSRETPSGLVGFLLFVQLA